MVVVIDSRGLTFEIFIFVVYRIFTMNHDYRILIRYCYFYSVYDAFLLILTLLLCNYLNVAKNKNGWMYNLDDAKPRSCIICCRMLSSYNPWSLAHAL